MEIYANPVDCQKGFEYEYFLFIVDDVGSKTALAALTYVCGKEEATRLMEYAESHREDFDSPEEFTNPGESGGGSDSDTPDESNDFTRDNNEYKFSRFVSEVLSAIHPRTSGSLRAYVDWVPKYCERPEEWR